MNLQRSIRETQPNAEHLGTSGSVINKPKVCPFSGENYVWYFFFKKLLRFSKQPRVHLIRFDFVAVNTARRRRKRLKSGRARRTTRFGEATRGVSGDFKGV